MPDLGAYMVTATDSKVAWAIRKITNSPVNHAAIYVGRGLVVEAQPSGARLARVTIYPDAIFDQRVMPLQVRAQLVSEALKLVGTPYNFLDIFAQMIVRVFHWHAPNWALSRLSRSTRLQCSQLVDLAYHRAGIALFADGRPDGLVAPADLYNILEPKHG